MRLWQLWAGLLVCWLLTACAVYMTAQAGYVIFRLAQIVAVAGD